MLHPHGVRIHGGVHDGVEATDKQKHKPQSPSAGRQTDDGKDRSDDQQRGHRNALTAPAVNEGAGGDTCGDPAGGPGCQGGADRDIGQGNVSL